MRSRPTTSGSQPTRLRVVSLADGHVVASKPKRARRESEWTDDDRTRGVSHPPAHATIDLSRIEAQIAHLAAAVAQFRPAPPMDAGQIKALVQDGVEGAMKDFAIPDYTPVVIEKEVPAPVSDVLLSSFAALGYALSARALLLLSLVGAFVLAILAMGRGDLMGLGVLIAYSVLTVCPVAYLEARKLFKRD